VIGELTNKYLRMDRLPHMWCPGCGHGIALGALLRAFDRVKIDKDKTVILSGIGCASRAVGYLDFSTVHTTHGRALAFATGLRLLRDDVKVIVIMGDGDALAIGGNHFIHACRRNIDITAIVLNNQIYGMTGGQGSPTTPQSRLSTTTPYGNFARAFDFCNLAIGAGATYVARATAYHASLMTELYANAIKHHGFSFVETFTQCPVNYGRRNKFPDPASMLKYMKDISVPFKVAEKMGSDELQGKIVIGELIKEKEDVELNEVVRERIMKFRGGAQ